MKKRTYRKVAVKDIDVDALASELGGGRAVFAIDVAKVDMVAAIVAGDGRVIRTVCWKNPGENGLLLELLAALGRAGLSVEAVMESSGTYGDVLRHQLQERGVPVFRVSGKRTHDAAEVYDGVPSLHDAKSAAIIAALGWDRAWWCSAEYLWLAVFRWLQKDAVARAWYAQKIKRDGGRRARGVIALMRKFAQALFHAARGKALDSSKLFDVSRLRLA